MIPPSTPNTPPTTPSSPTRSETAQDVLRPRAESLANAISRVRLRHSTSMIFMMTIPPPPERSTHPASNRSKRVRNGAENPTRVLLVIQFERVGFPGVSVPRRSHSPAPHLRPIRGPSPPTSLDVYRQRLGGCHRSSDRLSGTPTQLSWLWQRCCPASSLTPMTGGKRHPVTRSSFLDGIDPATVA